MSINKVDMQVIDDKLLVDAILDDKVPAEAEALRANGEPNLVDLAPTVSRLVLSFKGLGRIENLVGFDRLTSLCLDNNAIEDMSAVSGLPHLTWLDLSFNKIRKISGLESLPALRDVSLYSNKITAVEGLDGCPQLEVLSLGNNRVAATEQLLRLRRIGSLKSLSIAGNPVVQDPECVPMVLAYLESLSYLDYALIEPLDRHNAKEAYHDELMDVEEKESVQKEKSVRDAATAEYECHLTTAGCLYAFVVFDLIMQGDVDLEKLKHLPGAKDQVEAFRAAFKAMSEDFLVGALARHKARAAEVAAFERVVRGMRAADDGESTGLIDAFTRQNKALVLLLTRGPGQGQSGAEGAFPPHEVQRMVEALHADLEEVTDKLMTLEMRQVEKFDALADDFDNRMAEVKNSTLEHQQTFFRAVEAQEDGFSTALAALISDLLGRLAREELAQDFLDDEAVTLLMDRESCMGVLGLSHDMHIGRILKQEDEARSGAIKAYTQDVQGRMAADRDRNRHRVLEIHEFGRAARQNMNALLVLDEDEAEEEGQ